MGLRYTNKKVKTHKIEKVEKTYIKGRRGIKFYYDSTHYDEFEYNEDYDKEMANDTNSF